jgi:tetratricopeptide (TPR) repeat protein
MRVRNNIIGIAAVLVIVVLVLCGVSHTQDNTKREIASATASSTAAQVAEGQTPTTAVKDYKESEKAAAVELAERAAAEPGFAPDQVVPAAAGENKPLEGLVMAGQVYYDWKDYKSAISKWEEALKVNPDNKELS